MQNNPLIGAGYLLEGMRLITRPGLRRFVVVPFAVNVLVFTLAIVAGMEGFERILSGLESRLPSWLSWLDWILWPLFVLVLLVIVFNLFAVVANLIAAPFNGLLAERVESALCGRALDEPIAFGDLLRDALPALLDEVKKLLYGLVLAIPFLLLLLIPLFGQILWFLYVAWILAIQYADYPMGNQGLKFREMRRQLGQRRGLALGFGAAVSVLSLIPIINFILMPSAVAGATALWVRGFKGPSGQGYQSATQSRVATRCVLLIIDHLSGKITGEMLCDPAPGQTLAETETQDLVELLHRCYANDPDSADALEVYLERERGVKASETQGYRRASDAERARPERMPPDEARAILGVDQQAGVHEIRAAHRRLIQRLHPDRGGSDYLAAKINEAKQILLD
jgi:CysZ protein